MTKHDWLEISALGVGALALFVIFSRTGTNAGTATNEDGGTQTPPYLTYNQGSDYSPPTDKSALNIPQYQGSSNASPCQCGGGNDLITFSDAGSFAQTLGGQLGIDLQAYQNAVTDQFPDYVRQFFNETASISDATPAATRFASLGGG